MDNQGPAKKRVYVRYDEVALAARQPRKRNWKPFANRLPYLIFLILFFVLCITALEVLIARSIPLERQPVTTVGKLHRRFPQSDTSNDNNTPAAQDTPVAQTTQQAQQQTTQQAQQQTTQQAQQQTTQQAQQTTQQQQQTTQQQQQTTQQQQQTTQQQQQTTQQQQQTTQQQQQTTQQSQQQTTQQAQQQTTQPAQQQTTTQAAQYVTQQTTPSTTPYTPPYVTQTTPAVDLNTPTTNPTTLPYVTTSFIDTLTSSGGYLNLDPSTATTLGYTFTTTPGAYINLDPSTSIPTGYSTTVPSGSYVNLNPSTPTQSPTSAAPLQCVSITYTSWAVVTVTMRRRAARTVENAVTYTITPTLTHDLRRDARDLGDCTSTFTVIVSSTSYLYLNTPTSPAASPSTQSPTTVQPSTYSPVLPLPSTSSPILPLPSTSSPILPLPSTSSPILPFPTTSPTTGFSLPAQPTTPSIGTTTELTKTVTSGSYLNLNTPTTPASISVPTTTPTISTPIPVSTTVNPNSYITLNTPTTGSSVTNPVGPTTTPTYITSSSTTAGASGSSLFTAPSTAPNSLTSPIGQTTTPIYGSSTSASAGKLDTQISGSSSSGTLAPSYSPTSGYFIASDASKTASGPSSLTTVNNDINTANTVGSGTIVTTGRTTANPYMSSFTGTTSPVASLYTLPIYNTSPTSLTIMFSSSAFVSQNPTSIITSHTGTQTSDRFGPLGTYSPTSTTPGPLPPKPTPTDATSAFDNVVTGLMRVDMQVKMPFVTRTPLYIAIMYFPSFIAVILQELWYLVAAGLRLMEPFRLLSQQEGASAQDTLMADYLGGTSSWNLFKRGMRGNVVIIITLILNVVMSVLAPLATGSMTVISQGTWIEPDGSIGRTAGAWALSSSFVRILQGVLGFVTLLIVIIAFLSWRRRSGLSANPSKIATMAALLNHPDMVQDLQSIDPNASDKKVAQALAHNRYMITTYEDQHGNYRCGLIKQGEAVPEGLHEVASDDDTIHGSTTDAPQYSKREKSWLQKISSVFFELYYIVLVLGLLGIILGYWKDGKPDGFNKFFSTGRFGPRFILSFGASLVSIAFQSIEREVRLMTPYRLLAERRAPSRATVLRANNGTALSSIYQSIRHGSWFHLFIAIVALLSDILIITIAGVPFNFSETWGMFLTSFYTSCGILGLMILATMLTFLWRRKNRRLFIPDEPNGTLIRVWMSLSNNDNRLRKVLDDMGDRNNREIDLRFRRTVSLYWAGWVKDERNRNLWIVDKEYYHDPTGYY